VEWRNTLQAVAAQPSSAVSVMVSSAKQKDSHTTYHLCNVPGVLHTFVRWKGEVPFMSKIERGIQLWFKSLEKTDHPEDLEVDGRIILNWKRGLEGAY
jgi:hypothetical protein